MSCRTSSVVQVQSFDEDAAYEISEQGNPGGRKDGPG
jgi:hypothetical protein